MDGVGQVMLTRNLREFFYHFWRWQVVRSIVHFKQDQFNVPDFICQIMCVGQDIIRNDVGSCAKPKGVRLHYAPIRKVSKTTISTISTTMPNTSPVTPPIRDFANNKIKAAAPTPASTDKTPRMPRRRAIPSGRIAPQRMDERRKPATKSAPMPERRARGSNPA